MCQWIQILKKALGMTRPKTSFFNFFKNAPCQEVELSIARSKDLPREFDLTDP